MNDLKSEEVVRQVIKVAQVVRNAAFVGHPHYPFAFFAR